jgi:putative hydrolase of the HAD superfamily
MIKNIVFDLGNVLLSFKPAEYLEKNKYPETIKAIILSDIFSSVEWQMLDRGEISTPDAIEAISKKSSLRKEEIAHIFNLRTDLMFPLDPNVRLLPALKKRGLRLFYLSNFPGDIFEEVKSGYYFFQHFEGGLISAEVKHAKPDIRIYELLMEKYSLIPEECLFIDDIEVNVISARKSGMTGFFTNGSLEIGQDIEKVLKDV